MNLVDGFEPSAPSLDAKMLIEKRVLQALVLGQQVVPTPHAAHAKRVDLTVLELEFLGLDHPPQQAQNQYINKKGPIVQVPSDRA